MRKALLLAAVGLAAAGCGGGAGANTVLVPAGPDTTLEDTTISVGQCEMLTKMIGVYRDSGVGEHEPGMIRAKESQAEVC